MFSTAEMAAYYQVSEQTIRAWSKEFADDLSPTSNPGIGKNRSFALEDFSVLTIVDEMKKQRKAFEEIHAALNAGQRAQPPDLTEKDMKALAATEGEKKATLEIQALQQYIIDLQQRLNRAEETAEASEALKIKNAQLETRVEILQSQADELVALRTEVRRLEREVGKTHGQAYIEGYKAGLREQGLEEE